MNQKKSTIKRRKYDAAFKTEVLQMVSNGRPAGEVAQALGIGENLIYKWKRSKAAGQPAGPPAALEPCPFELQAENERLKSALRRAEQERDILKKALFIFSQPS
jgi:transposase